MPSDRPPLSAPAAVYPTILLLYLVQGSVPALSMMLWGALLHPPRDLLGDYLIPYVLVVGGWLVALLIGLRNGRLWAVRATRWTAAALAAAALAAMAVAVLLSLGSVGDRTRESVLLGRFGIGGSLLCLLMLLALWRRIQRIRWLDPRAEADRWEPAAPRPRVARSRR